MKKLILALVILTVSCAPKTKKLNFKDKTKFLPVRVIHLYDDIKPESLESNLIESLEEHFHNTDIGFDILEYKTVKDSKGYNGFDNVDQTFKYIYYEYKSDDFVTIVLKSSNYGIGVTYLRTNIIAVSEDVVSSRIPSHELGHMLGLNHSEGIMGQSRNGGYFSLRQVKAIEDQAQVLINKINN